MTGRNRTRVRLAGWCGVLLFVAALAGDARGQVAGTSGADDLVVVDGGRTEAVVAVAADAGEWEKKAAADLVHFVGLMSGAKPTLADSAETVAAALAGKVPVFVVGRAALAAEPSLG